jgi:hypothetical protein
MLDRLEARAADNHKALRDMAAGRTPEDMEARSLTKGEAETVEALIMELSSKLLGSDPPPSMWESIHTYAQRNYDRKKDWADNEAEYFRWYLMGIQKTRIFLDYLEGFMEGSAEQLLPVRSVTNKSTPSAPGMESVFISYGGPDERFATIVNDGLRRAGVSTFFFPDDAPPGEKLHNVMRDGVNQYGRVVLICSRSSLDRAGVANEIEEALQREAREGGQAILIPVTIDDYVFSEWDPKNSGVAQALRDRVVADFRGTLRDPEAFEKALGRVVAVLSKH